MKPLNHLLAAAVLALGVSLSAQAGEPLLSPRAKEQADSLRKVPAVPNQVNLALDRPAGNARAWELARSVRSVPSSGPSVDLAHAPRPTLSPRDPRFEAAWRANAERQFQIAPVK